MSIGPDLQKKLQAYTVPSRAVDLIRSSKIVFLVGITAAGKDTVIGQLLKSGDYHYIVSHTTRLPRYNQSVLEQDGLDYHFVDEAKMAELLDNQELIEAKIVHENIYGTSISEIQEAHDRSEIAISEVDVQGAAEFRAVSATVLPIFMLPPSFPVWQERLVKRYGGNVDLADLHLRMKTAKSELQDALEKDYFEFVINIDLAETIKTVDAIAHGSLSSKKNDKARAVAEQLMADIEAYCQNNA